MKLKEGLVIQKIEDEYILIDSGVVTPSFSGMIKLNETSKQIIDLLLKEDLEENQIVKKLLEIYDEKEEVIKEAVSEFIKELKKVPVFAK